MSIPGPLASLLFPLVRPYTHPWLPTAALFGYCDSSFAFRKDSRTSIPVLIDVAHELQKEERIESEVGNVRLYEIVTARAVYERAETVVDFELSFC